MIFLNAEILSFESRDLNDLGILDGCHASHVMPKCHANNLTPFQQ